MSGCFGPLFRSALLACHWGAAGQKQIGPVCRHCGSWLFWFCRFCRARPAGENGERADIAGRRIYCAGPYPQLPYLQKSGLRPPLTTNLVARPQQPLSCFSEQARARLCAVAICCGVISRTITSISFLLRGTLLALAIFAHICALILLRLTPSPVKYFNANYTVLWRVRPGRLAYNAQRPSQNLAVCPYLFRF